MLPLATSACAQGYHRGRWWVRQRALRGITGDGGGYVSVRSGVSQGTVVGTSACAQGYHRGRWWVRQRALRGITGDGGGYVSVRSGVSQGMVVGPALSLAYTNDLPEQLTSKTRLFAYDTAVYTLPSTDIDQRQRQLDPQRLENWEQRWDMTFHLEKCSTLPVTRNRSTSCHLCQLSRCHHHPKHHMGPGHQPYLC